MSNAIGTLTTPSEPHIFSAAQQPLPCLRQRGLNRKVGNRGSGRCPLLPSTAQVEFNTASQGGRWSTAWQKKQSLVPSYMCIQGRHALANGTTCQTPVRQGSSVSGGLLIPSLMILRWLPMGVSMSATTEDFISNHTPESGASKRDSHNTGIPCVQGVRQGCVWKAKSLKAKSLTYQCVMYSAPVGAVIAG